MLSPTTGLRAGLARLTLVRQATRPILLHMIIHESSYRRWLAARGVGDRDRVASSPASYVSYLNSVSDLLGEDVSPTLVSHEADVQDILARLDGRRSQDPHELWLGSPPVRSYGAGWGSPSTSRLTIGCRGCGALHAFGGTRVLRAGPAPLTLVSLAASHQHVR